MIKFTKTLQLRDQNDCLQSCFGKVLGGAIMKYKLKDPGSAITHGIAFLLAAVGAAPLLIRSSEWSDHYKDHHMIQLLQSAVHLRRRINGMIKSTCRIKQHHRKNKHSQCHNMNMIAPL